MSVQVGWIGTGRMGFPLVERLLAAGVEVSVFNRTRAKAEPLAAQGATLVSSAAELAGLPIVFTMIDADAALLDVTTGPQGVLSQPGTAPAVLVDSSTVSVEASEVVRAVATAVGCDLVAAPVSGNPGAVRSGNLVVVASGPAAAYAQVEEVLSHFGAGVTYAGEGDAARVAKICHNVLLGAVTQSLAEITVLAERAGIRRAALFEFLNRSALGSRFTGYKAPAFVGLDMTATATTRIIRKDQELGLALGRTHNVPMPVTSLVQQALVHAEGLGYAEEDFASLLYVVAQGAGLTLEAEEPG